MEDWEQIPDMKSIMMINYIHKFIAAIDRFFITVDFPLA